MNTSVFHVAANIRFWERARFTYKYSKRVNVDGTKNVIEALAQSQETSEKILVYCSSAAVQLPEPMIMRLGRNFRDYAASYLLSDHWDIPDHHRAGHDYAVSKTEADKLVRLANGYNGIRSGVVSSRISRRVCLLDQLFTCQHLIAATTWDDGHVPYRSGLWYE